MVKIVDPGLGCVNTISCPEAESRNLGVTLLNIPAQPDVDPLKRYTPDLANDCRSGSKTCHSRATCHDDEAGEESGFCCRYKSVTKSKNL